MGGGGLPQDYTVIYWDWGYSLFPSPSPNHSPRPSSLTIGTNREFRLRLIKNEKKDTNRAHHLRFFTVSLYHILTRYWNHFNILTFVHKLKKKHLYNCMYRIHLTQIFLQSMWLPCQAYWNDVEWYMMWIIIKITQLSKLTSLSTKKVLIVKKSQGNPLYPSSPKKDQVDNENKDMGVVLHDPGEGYQQPTTFWSGTSQVPLSFNEVSQVKITNWVHCIWRAKINCQDLLNSQLHLHSKSIQLLQELSWSYAL